MGYRTILAFGKLDHLLPLLHSNDQNEEKEEEEDYSAFAANFLHAALVELYLFTSNKFIVNHHEATLSLPVRLSVSLVPSFLLSLSLSLPLFSIVYFPTEQSKILHLISLAILYSLPTQKESQLYALEVGSSRVS